MAGLNIPKREQLENLTILCGFVATMLDTPSKL